VRTKRYMALSLVLAGAFAGLGGAVEVLGLHHRMFTDGSAFGFTGSAGFNGIVAALFGQLHPIGTIPASFLLGALLTGANKMQRMMQIPSALIGALNGLIVLLVVGSEFLRRHRIKHTQSAESERAETSAEEEEA
ncbi:MAG TPA: ABC transporter permease, partial [Candidatus Acetothermia bacterium]|nr:ABC transporter permease [Candidatus Acetothermia bacterium]HEX32311.1 ABC transporter permease [Candidatus Acetothermia bacterium]